MLRRIFTIISFVLYAGISHGQEIKPDSMTTNDDLGIDTLDYDELVSELDAFLNSILSPRSYWLAGISAGQGYFNFSKTNNTEIEVMEKVSISPSIGYYSKKGWGLTATGYIVGDSRRLNFYQLSLSPSFDYLKDPDIALGLAYIRYFTKDSLSFYTSPLQNEITGYFLWRKPWLQPGISLNYGSGSKTEVTKRRRYFENLGISLPVTTITEESIVDFSATATLRHNFYWLNVFATDDYIRLSPIVSFSAGTQKFGFNQTTGTYAPTRNNIYYSAGNVNLDEQFRFQPLSLTLFLRTEYSIGKFFVQPQFILDYYFPGEEKKLSALFALNTGFQF
jgi:hypothetical protein